MNAALTFSRKVKLSRKDSRFEIFHSRAIEKVNFLASESIYTLWFLCVFFFFSCLFWDTYLMLHLCTFPSIWSHPDNLYHLNTGTSESSSSVLFGTDSFGMKIVGLTHMSNRERQGIFSAVDSSRAISTHIWLDGHSYHMATHKWCHLSLLMSNFRHLKNISVHKILESD